MLTCSAAETERQACPDTPATRTLRTAFSLLNILELQGAGEGQGAIVWVAAAPCCVVLYCAVLCMHSVHMPLFACLKAVDGLAAAEAGLCMARLFRMSHLL